MREDARLGFIGVIGGLVLFAWDRGDEQLARAGDVLGADAACEQAVMANAVKAGWQDLLPLVVRPRRSRSPKHPPADSPEHRRREKYHPMTGREYPIATLYPSKSSL